MLAMLVEKTRVCPESLERTLQNWRKTCITKGLATYLSWHLGLRKSHVPEIHGDESIPWFSISKKITGPKTIVGDFKPQTLGSEINIKKNEVSPARKTKIPRHPNNIPDMRNGYLDALLRASSSTPSISDVEFSPRWRK